MRLFKNANALLIAATAVIGVTAWAGAAYAAAPQILADPGASVAVPAVAAVPTIDLWALAASLWKAIAPTIDTAALLSAAAAWAATTLPKADAASPVVWRLARGLVDLLGANVGNAKNLPKA